MPQLWYTSDEVNDFHPPVEQALNNALIKCGYNNIAEIVHHPSIPNSTIIPDFAIRLKASLRYIFICEVKRTERDVESQRYQNQTRSYVTDFGPHWEPGYHKYFCITNIERLVFFADRNGPLITCLLKGNPRQHTKFNPANHNATASIADLQSTFEILLPIIFQKVNPEWDNNWELIIETFHSNYVALKNSLGYPDAVSKELSLYELFRLLAYSYLKDYYQQSGNPNAQYFRNYPQANAPLANFTTNLSNNYDRIIQLDFRQIFSNHPNQGQRIFPDNFSANYLAYFRDLIQCFNQYSSNAVADNSAPSYVFNLLTSRIYERHELHKKGKVMTDGELSNLLASLCIDNHSAKVLDPGCGDGALLDAAYDQINLIASSANINKLHNQILTQVDGIEIDPFLSQLAAFRLLSKNLTQVNNTTQANILIGDIFQNQRTAHYDAILMNPPFLRNDNPDAPITNADKARMVNAIQAAGLNCFVTEASQPNLYYYFTNYIWHYLRNNGKAGIILMTKFLNNEDGEYLKNFLLDKVEVVISYPRKYFKDFVVTTVIVILKKGNNSGTVSFLRITDENILLNPDSVKNILAITQDSTTAGYKLKVVPRNTLVASDNWRQYLQDQNFDTFLGLNFLVNINHHFATIKRGNSENDGGAKLIYPYFDAATNSYHGYGSKPQEKRIDIPAALNNFIGYGIKNNNVRRHYVLDLADLEINKAFHFPEVADNTTNNGLSPALQQNTDLNLFYNSCSADFVKWKKIVTNAYKHTYIPKIIIPRSDRAKHVVYYNPHNHNITLSTNFVYCNDLQNKNPNITDDLQYKFITAFLLSAFGQIQFELNGNNQDGLRKSEVFHINKIKVPDLSTLAQNEIDPVVNELTILSVTNVDFNGGEGINTPRRALDLAIGNLLFTRNSLGFANVTDMVDYFELFLADLVEDRRL